MLFRGSTSPRRRRNTERSRSRCGKIDDQKSHEAFWEFLCAKRPFSQCECFLFQIWRRSYATPPPPVEVSDERWPGKDPKYQVRLNFDSFTNDSPNIFDLHCTLFLSVQGLRKTARQRWSFVAYCSSSEIRV